MLCGNLCLKSWLLLPDQPKIKLDSAFLQFLFWYFHPEVLESRPGIEPARWFVMND
jgi:hypothetical protein